MDTEHSKTTRVLATDLDGTLIPLNGDAAHVRDMQVLAREIEQHSTQLIFVTGRHLESVQTAIEEYQLPVPDWIICDVGTSIYERVDAQQFVAKEEYQEHLAHLIATLPITRRHLESIAGLRLQRAEKQGRFKLSFDVDAVNLRQNVQAIDEILLRLDAPYSIVHSVDPWDGKGLIDLLPKDVSKAHAVAWWTAQQKLSFDAIVFAGDSGNDLAVLTTGYNSIVVANAQRDVARHAYDTHRVSGWTSRLYLARQTATSGVLEGCHWYQMFGPSERSVDRLGATPLSPTRSHFKVWAPLRRRVAVQLEGAERVDDLTCDESGYFSGTVQGAGPGARYQYLLDGELARPDPATAFQPDGVHGPSQVIDPSAFAWTDQAWQGIEKRDLVIYELHVGTFTSSGTFREVIEHLDRLVELGVSAIEVMPVAQSPGRWNWGYDGVNLFAVRNTYGTPDDFKAMVDACHARGIAVLLDVVYNHLGPEGNYLADFGPYFSRQHHTPWGAALNFDEPHAEQVRRFVIENALYWLTEFHLDGLRLDAVHSMLDNSDVTILDQLSEAVEMQQTELLRHVHLIAEANVYDHRLLSQDSGNQDPGNTVPYDAIWCDCLMHSIYSVGIPDLRLTHREYRGASDIAEALANGYLYHGSSMVRANDQDRAAYAHRDQQHLGSLVMGLQTHDSVGHHPHGRRLHQLTSVDFQKAAAALILLYPCVPLIFMGEELAVESLFPFFADFEDDRLRAAVDAGRAREYPQHLWQGALAPSDPRAFQAAKLNIQKDGNRDVWDWYRKLLALRKRGRAEGWLSSDRMRSHYDASTSIYTVRYDVGSGKSILLHVRLQHVDAPTAPVELSFPEGVLLSSRGLIDGQRTFQIHENHALVGISKG